MLVMLILSLLRFKKVTSLPLHFTSVSIRHNGSRQQQQQRSSRVLGIPSTPTILQILHCRKQTGIVLFIINIINIIIIIINILSAGSNISTFSRKDEEE